MEQESYDIGDKVKHPKFGQGTVTLRQGEGDTEKLTIKFSGEVGEKKLMVKFANLKRLQERPTLPAAPAAEAAVAPIAAVAGRKQIGADNDGDEEEVPDLGPDVEVGDEDEDDDALEDEVLEDEEEE